MHTVQVHRARKRMMLPTHRAVLARVFGTAFQDLARLEIR